MSNEERQALESIRNQLAEIYESDGQSQRAVYRQGRAIPSTAQKLQSVLQGLNVLLEKEPSNGKPTTKSA